MFPDIPMDNIHYDLLRTGSTERTVNKVLETGFLPAPPPSYVRSPTEQPARPVPSNSAQPIKSNASKTSSLISRFHLEPRLERDEPAVVSSKSSWEATPSQRQANLAERKAQMILAARKRLLEKQAQTLTPT